MPRLTLSDARRYGFGGETFNRIYYPGMAMDAALVTAPNIGVPQEFLTYLVNEVIDILTAKRSSREIATEVKKGDATTTSARFPVVEMTGVTDPYDDYASGGASGINANWPARDNYLFSTTRQYGDLEEARNSQAKISLAGQTQRSAAEIIDIDANYFNFYGVAGLRNYGLLNDPSLPASITPLPSGEGDSPLWSKKNGQQIYDDVLALFTQLVKQTGNHVEESTPLILAMSGTLSAKLGQLNPLGNKSVKAMIQEYLPNLKIVTAVQYSTTAGELMQLICPSIAAQDTAWLGFSEKFYAFAPVRRESSIVQKFRAGTYGAIIRRPLAVASMLGM